MIINAVKRNMVLLSMFLTIGYNVNAALHTHWKFDETGGVVATDSSGNGNNGTVNGNTLPTWTADGKDGGTITLDSNNSSSTGDATGLNQYVINDNAVTSADFANYTISLWTRPHVVNNSSSGLFNSSSAGFQIDVNSGKFRWAGQNTNNDWGSGTEKVNTWSHLVATCDGTTIKLFYNGAQVKSFTGSGKDFVFDRLVVGMNRGMNNTFKGDIDDFRIYDHAMSAAEVLALNANYGPLVAQWKFDDGVDTTAVDSSEHGLDATLTGCTWETGSLSFNGSSDFVTATGYKGISGSADRTIMAWVKTAADDTSNRPIVAWGENSTYAKNVFRISNLNGGGQIRFEVAGGGWNSTATVNDGEWHHVAMTWSNSGELRLFVNGAFDSNYTGLTSSVNTAFVNDVQIGKDVNGNYFSGSIKDVRIYSTALNDSDVTAIYNNAVTPVIGLETLLENGVLSWSTETEVGVKEYQVVDADTGEVIATAEAGLGSYSVEIPAGVNKVKLVVVDYSGYQQTFVAEDTVGSVVLELKEGWNLISVPFESDFDMDVWTWNSATQTYVVTDRLAQGQGGWIFSSAVETLTLEGETVEGAMAVDAGWNLIGPIENDFAPEGVLIYGWDKAYLQTDVMTVGNGYWIYTEEADQFDFK